MNYKYNELDYGKLIFENGFQTKHISTELRLVATYMRRILDYKPKQLREEMYKFCSYNIPDYNRVKHYKIINKAINKACEKNSTLIKIDNINIFDYEIKYINSLQICDADGIVVSHEYDCKKVVFTLLCLMKLNKIITKAKNGEESKGLYFKGGNRKYNNLKKVAKISSKVQINDDIIYALGKSKIVTIMFNGLIKLNFMENINKLSEENVSPNIIITVNNFDNIGWYFDYYNNIDNIKLCKYCSQPFKKTNNRQEYCTDDCSKIVEQENSKKRVAKHRNNNKCNELENR